MIATWGIPGPRVLTQSLVRKPKSAELPHIGNVLKYWVIVCPWVTLVRLGQTYSLVYTVRSPTPGRGSVTAALNGPDICNVNMLQE